VPVVFSFLEDKHTSTYSSCTQLCGKGSKIDVTLILNRQLIMKESVHVSENNLILNVFHQNKIVRIIMDTFSLAQS